MKENTVYLLYNTNASNVKLHHGLVADFNREMRSREWEYEDKDEFTIMYSQEDERKYTDIKIMSKTKLKERPKSADQLMNKPKISVEGILIRRSNSLSIIEEDLFVLRKCPQIKPLLSEAEIKQLQLLLEECRRKKQVMDKTESNVINGLHQLLPEEQDIRKATGDLKGTSPYENIKDTTNRSAYPQEFDINKARGKAKRLSHEIRNDKTVLHGKNDKTVLHGKNDKTVLHGKNDKTGKTKSLDKWEKTPILQSKKLKNGENRNYLASVNQEGKHKTHNVDGTTKQSEDRPKYDKRKSKTVRDVGSKKRRKTTPETHLRPEEKNLKKKSKTIREDEHKEKKQKKPITDSVKTKEEIDTTTSSKENLSEQDKFNTSSSKKSFHKQKESKKISTDNIKSKGNKIKLKNSKDKRRISSITEKSQKSDKSGKSKLIIDSETLSKDEKKPKSSILLSSKQSLKKGKTDKVKSKTPHEAGLAEDLLAEKDVISTQAKSSPSDMSKTTNKTKDSKTEVVSGNKGKTKDKLLPGTIQYIIHYILSDPIFINLGWTLQPTKKALSRIVTFKAVPANPQSYCFRKRDNVEQKFYPSGEPALNVAEDGTGRINYPGGAPAIIMTRSQAGMKLTLYSRPTKDPLVKESFYTKIIGMFDSYGNGVVYDSNGKTILNFNQLEGIYYNQSKQTPYKWQWSCFKVLEAQRLKELLSTIVNEVKQPVPATKRGKFARAPSSSSSTKSEVPMEKKIADKMYEALLEELPYPVMPKPKIKMKTHDNAFKSIILKINEEITLRINGQGSVAVNFSAKTLFYKMDLGVRIDPDNVERVEEIAHNKVGSMPNVLGDLLQLSPSLQKLHQLLDPNTLTSATSVRKG